jgi:prophage maintenance system killer protein
VFLAINGAHLTADAQTTYGFVAGLCDANHFSLEKLVPWLRRHVTHATPVDSPP